MRVVGGDDIVVVVVFDCSCYSRYQSDECVQSNYARTTSGHIPSRTINTKSRLALVTPELGRIRNGEKQNTCAYRNNSCSLLRWLALWLAMHFASELRRRLSLCVCVRECASHVCGLFTILIAVWWLMMMMIAYC